MISVIVPVLNNEAYIDRCIQSILAQTDQDFELLLMVGQCKDHSLEKCIAWQRKDERIIIVSRKDSSLGDARNYALPIAKGEYIAYVDADDWIAPDFLEKLRTPLEKDATIDLSCCGYAEQVDDTVRKMVLPEAAGVREVDFSSYLKFVIPVTVWSKMYRRAWLLEYGITMYDGLCEDMAMHAMVAAIVKKIYLYREPLYHYNVGNPDSLMTKRLFQAFMHFAYAIDFAMPFLQTYGIVEKYRKELIRFSCATLQGDIYGSDYLPDVVNATRWFVDKHFPEMAEYMRYAPHPVDFGEASVIIFGSGKDAMHLLCQLPKGMHVHYLVDNDAKKAGKSLCGVVIHPFSDLLQEPKDIPIVISTRNYRFEIAKQLKDAGFTNWCYIESILTQEQLRVPVEELVVKDKEA